VTETGHLKNATHAWRLVCWNGGLWGAGNGMASTMLVIYLALEFGARGMAISLILSAPKLAGVLQLAAPAFFSSPQRRKRFCLAMLLGSSLILLVLPVIAAPGIAGSAAVSLVVLVVGWSVYHLLEYLGVVALFAWLADLAPADVRGEWFGRRGRWLTGGKIAGALLSSLMALAWQQIMMPRFQLQPSTKWLAYGIPAGIGAALMIVSLAPLLRTRAGLVSDASRGSIPPRAPLLSRYLAALSSGPFLMLLMFVAWTGFANGMTQAPQGIYPKRVLLLPLFAMLTFSTSMGLGQSVLAPWAGRMIDRYGARRVMLVSQLVTATGPLFYLLASPASPWWAAGAWCVWVAYIGLNVALPVVVARHAKGGDAAPHYAIYYAISGLAYGLSTIAGGAWFDYLGALPGVWQIGPFVLDRFGWMFCAGFVLRAAGVLWLLPLPVVNNDADAGLKGDNAVR